MQDSWTATDRLTVELRLRYDIEWLSKYQGLDYGRDYEQFRPASRRSPTTSPARARTLVKFSNGLYLRPHLPEPDHADVLREQGNPAAGVRDLEFRPGWRAGLPADVSDRTLPATAPLGVRNVYIMPEDK